MAGPVAVEQVDRAWLIDQLEQWPTRVHPDRTTNVQYLMQTAAASLRSPTSSEGLGFRPMTDTAWLDGRDVILSANGMVVTARYSAGSWSAETPISPGEYDGAVWVCFDDAFQFEIEEITTDARFWHHGPVVGWCDALSAQAPTPPASSEGLREALTPSGSTKAAYHGEFAFEVFEGVSDAGIEQHRKVYVPWDTIKEIMKAILVRGDALSAQAVEPTTTPKLEHAQGGVIEWEGTEEQQLEARMRACRARRKRWGEDDCEEKDGSCAECEYDMALALRSLTPAAQAVEGMVMVPRAAMHKFRDMLYCALRSQQEDVRVNGAGHPGLLEPMAAILADRLSELDAMLNAAPVDIEESSK